MLLTRRMAVKSTCPPSSPVRRRSWLAGLRWRTPFRPLPHGILGVASLSLGSLLVLGSLFGRHELLESGWALPAYVLFTASNAVAGMLLARRIRSWKGVLFALTSVVQLCMLWCAWRFRPRALDAGAQRPFERVLDLAAGFGLLAINLAFLAFAGRVASEHPGAGVAVCGGSFGLALLSCYPVHLALSGDEWITCVVDRYPKQLQGLSGYVYVPATFMFAAMMFGATLLDRKLISGLQFGQIFGGGVGSVILTTVLSQELHIPFVSTQRIILPCPEAAPGSLLDVLVRRFDTSILAQTVLWLVGAWPPPSSQ